MSGDLHYDQKFAELMARLAVSATPAQQQFISNSAGGVAGGAPIHFSNPIEILDILKRMDGELAAVLRKILGKLEDIELGLQEIKDEGRYST
jgi:hypothetical protein